jgi:hypothetical protein
VAAEQICDFGGRFALSQWQTLSRVRSGGAKAGSLQAGKMRKKVLFWRCCKPALSGVPAGAEVIVFRPQSGRKRREVQFAQKFPQIVVHRTRKQGSNQAWITTLGIGSQIFLVSRDFRRETAQFLAWLCLYGALFHRSRRGCALCLWPPKILFRPVSVCQRRDRFESNALCEDRSVNRFWRRFRIKRCGQLNMQTALSVLCHGVNASSGEFEVSAAFGVA